MQRMQPATQQNIIVTAPPVAGCHATEASIAPLMPPALALILLLLAVLHPGISLAVEASFSRDVEPGIWTGVRLKNLPKAAILEVVIDTDGDIKVALTDSSITNKEKRNKPLFTGLVSKRMAFTVKTEQAGDHYIILDNRGGDTKRSVDLAVRARRSDDIANANEILSQLETTLHKIFIFKPIEITVRQCEKPNLYSVNGGIILCSEYVARIQKEIPDKQKIRDILVFALFHEIGHTLLEQWDYPFYDSEDVSDQFAVATLVMLEQKDRIRPVIELFSSRSPALEAIAKVEHNSGHPLSTERASDINRWLKDPEFIKKWQSVFMPHMQTTFLEHLLKNGNGWSDQQLVKDELGKRKPKSQGRTD